MYNRLTNVLDDLEFDILNGNRLCLVTYLEYVLIYL